jgi:hypothetical protein
MGRVEVGSQTFRGRRQSDGICFFVQIGFSSIKSPYWSRIFFWKLRNQYFILISFIESKKIQEIGDEDSQNRKKKCLILNGTSDI